MKVGDRENYRPDIDITKPRNQLRGKKKLETKQPRPGDMDEVEQEIHDKGFRAEEDDIDLSSTLTSSKEDMQ